MPNGENMLTEAEFENEINDMSDRQIAEFSARQLFQIRSQCRVEDARITALEKRDRKTFGVTGGASAVLGGVIVAVLDWVTKRSG